MVLQTLEVSESTLARWRQQYGGMKCEEAKRLKQLEDENDRLKRVLAVAELDKAILREAASAGGRSDVDCAATPRSRRASGSWLQTGPVSQGRMRSRYPDKTLQRLQKLQQTG